MKLLLVAPHYPPRFIGGVELATQRLAHRLRGLGHDVSVIAIEKLAAPGVATIESSLTDEDGVSVTRLALGSSPPERAFIDTYHHDALEAWLTDWLRHERPDLLHLQSGYLLGGAVLAAAATVGVPAVVTIFDFWFMCPRVTMLHPNQQLCSGPESPSKCSLCLATERRRFRWPANWFGLEASVGPARWLSGGRFALFPELARRRSEIDLRQRRLQRALAGAAVVIAHSQFLKEQMERAGFDSPAVSVMASGIDPLAVAPRRRPDFVRLRIGFIGQIVPHKGVHVLIDAIQLCPYADIELVIHGDLTREPEYAIPVRDRAKGDARIIFAGPIAREKLADLFNRVDIIVVPSVWYENSPYVIHEAQSAGLPVIASRLGGILELVRDGVDGLLVEPGSAESLAAQLRRVIEDGSLLDRLRQGIRRPTTVEEETRALVDVYNRVVGQTKVSPAPHA